MIDSFYRDIGFESNWKGDFFNAVKDLKSVGLLPTDDIKQTVTASSKPKLKAKLPPLFEMELDWNPKKINDIQFLYIIDHLKNLAIRYLLFILKSVAQGEKLKLPMLLQESEAKAIYSAK